MAVQAQYPSNAFMPEFRNRPRDNNRNYVMASAPVGEDEYEQQAAANLFRLYNNAGHAFNGTVFSDPESELTCNLSGSLRKRPRQDEQHQQQQQIFMAQRQRISQLMSVFPSEFQHKNMNTGLQLSVFDENQSQSPPCTSTSGRNSTSIAPALLSVVCEDLTAQLHQQNQEIQRFLKQQGEKVRLALEEKSQRHYRALVASIEQGIIRKLKEKETELEAASRRSVELEEHVRQLIIDNQIWQNLAKNNEAMVNALKNNLDQVVAQRKEQSREGYGDSEADDAESCCHDNDGNIADEHSRTLKENKELKAQRTCRVCKRNDICILLLPCRHLCLCKECGSRLETCPLCNSIKNASVQIYMS